MAAPSLTYSLTNGSTADASQVMQNFNDLLNGYTDGTKDLSISALTCAGTATLNGHVNLGNSSADDLTITASLAATLPIKTNTSYDIGSSTKGLQSAYFGGTSTFTGQVKAATLSASRVWTIPETAADASFVMTKAAQTIDGAKVFNAATTLGDSTSIVTNVCNGRFQYYVTTNTSSSGTLNNLAIGNAAVYYLSNASSKTITGLAAPSVEGTQIWLFNSGGTMNINHADAGSTSANQIDTGTAGNIAISGTGGVCLIYINLFWRVIGNASAANTY